VPDTVSRPYSFELVIGQGYHFHREFPLALDAETGDPFDFTGWTARMDVRRYDGQLVTEFATEAEDGIITLGTEGQVDIDLAAEFTAALEPTTEYAGTLHGPYYADLVFIDPDDVPWLRGKGVVTVTRNITDPTPEVEA
jgi:propanediol dehydratase large subunit